MEGLLSTGPTLSSSRGSGLINLQVLKDLEVYLLVWTKLDSECVISKLHGYFGFSFTVIRGRHIDYLFQIVGLRMPEPG